ncbi:MAG: hypothetical protein R3258_09905 [Acidimicrobiia bacterium]|nr:hypothetical protein [Acidimicrobiia bacterium]
MNATSTEARPWSTEILGTKVSKAPGTVVVEVDGTGLVVDVLDGSVVEVETGPEEQAPATRAAAASRIGRLIS